MLTLFFAGINSIKVSVFYETLCSDSILFFKNQLFTTYVSFPNEEYELIPYGKAKHWKSGDGWAFTCQNGKTECYCNKIHSCVLNQNATFSNKLSFIVCTIGSQSEHRYTQCATLYGINERNLQTCANSNTGENLLAIHGGRTNQIVPNIAFVQTFVFYENFDPNVQHLAFNNLSTALTQYKQHKRRS